MIWVHDYHLIPLAKALRERGHQNKIGFFLHVPFPPPEILTALPNHERLIPALCHYDLVGFQTEVDADEFLAAISPTNADCRARPRGQLSSSTSASVRIGVFPGRRRDGGLRSAWRAAPSSSTFVREVLDSLSGRAMIIGVDRLDYSKGLPQRMDAFERFLTNFPEWRGKVTYLQITPRSRSDIPEYADIERAVGEAAGRINGHFGEAVVDADALRQQGATAARRWPGSTAPRAPGW